MYKKKFLLINNKNHLSKYTYSDIVNCNYVIMNYNVLHHPSYLLKWQVYLTNNQSYETALKTIILEKSRSINILN